MFVLYALYSSSFLPRRHVTPGADQHSLAVPKSITPTNPPPTTHHHKGQCALAPSPANAHGPNQHCPPKRNKTKLKRDKMAPRCFPCQSSWQARAGPPQRRVQLKMMTTEITSQVVVLQRSYTLALVCPFGYSEALRSKLIPMHVMFSNMTDTIKCCFASVCGAWRVSEELAIQENRNKHSIRY